MTEIRFAKMHGIGNDFLVLPLEELKGVDPAQFARRACRRHFGVGADGIILVCPSDAAPVRMRMFNPDGTEAEMCGNGVRCFARYVVEKEIAAPDETGVLKCETGAGVLELTILENKSVRVMMGRPSFLRTLIPDEAKDDPEAAETLDVLGSTLAVDTATVGNPHCVVLVDDLDALPFYDYGPAIETHELFPGRINVEFVQPLTREHARVRVWERGAGETLACGSGATAVGFVLVSKGLADSPVTLELPGGELVIEIEGDTAFLTGPAEWVFEGTINYHS